MKPYHAAAFGLVAFILSGCTARGSWDPNLPIESVVHPDAIAARNRNRDVLVAQCQTGDAPSCQSVLNWDCRNEDRYAYRSLEACRTLCQDGDQAACIDYKRLTNEAIGPTPP